MQEPTGTSTTQQQTEIMWRCPQCGFIFSPYPKIVRCPRCNENLRKCRYCKFADTMTWECTNNRIRFSYGDELGRFHIPEPDHVWACPENIPDLKAPNWAVALSNPMLRGLSIGAVVVVLLLLVFRFIILPAILPQEVPTSPLLLGEVVLSKSQFSVGESIPLLLVVKNAEATVTLEPCIVVLRGELVEQSEIKAQPSPNYPPQRTPKSIQMHFPGIAPQQSFTVWIYLIPFEAKPRSYDLTIEVYCGGYRAVMNPPSVRINIR